MTIPLHSLAGEPADPDMLNAWECLQALPADALEHLWEVLTPALAQGPAGDYQKISNLFCKAYECTPEDVARATSICDFLLRRAAGRDLPAALFEEDLTALSRGNESGKGILLAGYESAKQALRQEARLDSVFGHGKVVTGVDWRVERVLSSSRADKLDVDVVTLTLGYRDGSREERASFQLTPESIAKLRALCAHFPAAAPEGDDDAR